MPPAKAETPGKKPETKTAGEVPETKPAGEESETQTAGAVADYAPPPVTGENVMEVIENGNRRILSADGAAIIDLSQMGDSDSTALCALLEWIATGKQNGGITFQNIQPRQTQMLSLYQLTDLITPYCR